MQEPAEGVPLSQSVHSMSVSPTTTAVLLLTKQRKVYEFLAPGASPPSATQVGSKRPRLAAAPPAPGPARLAEVSEEPDTLAAAAMPEPAGSDAGTAAAAVAEGVWLVLNETYGVLQLGVGSAAGQVEAAGAGAAAQEQARAGLGPAQELTAEQRMQVCVRRRL